MISLFRTLLIAAGLSVLAAFISADAEPLKVGPVHVSLVAEELSVQPGRPFEVGLYIQPDEHWHVYWQNPGDAGLPPTLQWSLPDGFTVSAITFPAPVRIDAGPVTAYGYHGNVLYPVTIKPPADITPGDTLFLTVKADWLVCKEECLPGSAELSLTLPVSEIEPNGNKETSALFEQTRQRIPVAVPDNWSTQASLTDDYLYLDIQPDSQYLPAPNFQFFPTEKAVIQHADEQPVTDTENSYRIQLTRSPYSTAPPDSLTGVLAVSFPTDTTYYSLQIPFGNQENSIVSASSSQQVNSLVFALLFAFLGGLILNLMPCVLPVLSLKVLGLVQQASQGRKAAFMHGLLFTLGVLVSFWAIVGIMFILQAGGAQLGWGFQLQSPTFVMILATGMFLFALSLFGLFEIGFLVGTAGSLASNHASGLSSAFISGITATLVATPCTAPFMGAALGYSLTQPPLHSFLIYTMLAFGMAAPYLLLSIFPHLLKFVPKPGQWMETLKQALGFLLAATVIWLAWVLGNQAGLTALIFLLVVLLFVSIAAWIYGRWGNVHVPSGKRWFSRTVAAGIILLALFIGHRGITQFQVVSQVKTDNSKGIAWEKYSNERFKQLRQDGQPIFIDFTAAWCLSCQVNEKVAFSSKEVQDKFSSLGIIPLKADWTHRSEEITKALAKYGRNSVPLYVLYSSGQQVDPVLLPEILTPGIVLEALTKIESTSES